MKLQELGELQGTWITLWTWSIITSMPISVLKTMSHHHSSMMKRWKHKTPHLRRKTKNEALFVFKLMMCNSRMNNVILCLFLVVFILCFVEQCVLWCYVLYSVFYVMFVILMFVFNFNVFVHHCSRIFRFLPNK